MERERGLRKEREGGREGGRERSLHSLLEVEREEIELCMGLYQSNDTQLLQSWNCSGRGVTTVGEELKQWERG